MISQRADGLHERYEPDGCYVCSIAMMAYEARDPSEPITLRVMANAFVALNESRALSYRYKDWSKRGLFVMDAEKVAQYFAPGITYIESMNVGTNDHTSKSLHEILSVLHRSHRAVEKWRVEREGGGAWVHFTYGNYDPWPGSITRRDGELVGLRIFRLP